MDWKTLLTVVTRKNATPPAFPALEAAIGLARREDAHLEILALGPDLGAPGYVYVDASMVLLQEGLTRAREEAEALEAALRQRMAPEDIRWSVESALSQLGGFATLVSQRARFSDLVVLARPYGPGCTQLEEVVLESALFDAGRPVLVLPEGMSQAPEMARITVAWNQSPEAMAAIRAALPLMQRAGRVEVVIVDPAAHGPERSDPGGALSHWLARHGVRTEVSVLARTLPRVSEVLMRHARDRDSDLLVMGAYGHSRFRQAILGGATRDLLEGAAVPVLMVH